MLGGQPEDGRYVYLREHFGPRADLHFAWFFQAQALLAALLSLPFLLATRNPAEAIQPVQWVGVALFAAAKTLVSRDCAPGDRVTVVRPDGEVPGTLSTLPFL